MPRNRPDIESLESRQLFAATPVSGWSGDVPVAQQDMQAALRQALLEDPSAWSTTDLQALKTAATQDPEFAAIAHLSSAWEREQEELQFAHSRQSAIRQDLIHLQTRRTTEQSTKDANVTQQNAANNQMQNALTQQSALQKSVQSLTMSVTSLQSEQVEVEQKIPQLQQQITTYQSQLMALSVKRSDLSGQLKPLLDQAALWQAELKTVQASLLKKPRDKTLLNRQTFLTSSLSSNQLKINDYQKQIATIDAQKAAAQKSLDAAKADLSRCQARKSQLPAEITNASAQRTAALANLANVTETVDMLTTQVQRLQELVRSDIARLFQTDSLIQSNQFVFEELAADIAETQSDLAAMHAAIDAARDDIQAPAYAAIDLAPDSLETSVNLLSQGSPVQPAVWNVPLAGMGSFDIRSWRGSGVASPVMKGATPDQLRRATVASTITPEQVNATLRLDQLLGIPNGYQGFPNSLQNSMTKTSPLFGSVTVTTEKTMVNASGIITGADVTFSNGQPQYKNLGRSVHVEFGSGPRYVRWIDVSHLSGLSTGMLQVRFADGSYRDIPAGEGGPIAIDAEITGLTVAPGDPAAAYGLRAISGEHPSTPTVAPGGEWLQFDGAASGMDFRALGKTVTAAEFQVLSDRANDIVTAHGYRGQQLLVSQTVSNDGTVRLADERGITSIVLSKSDRQSTAAMSGLRLTTTDESPFAAGPLSNQTNGTLSRAAAPVWEKGIPYNFIDVGTRAGVQFRSPGDLQTVNGSSMVSVPDVSDGENYVRSEVRTRSGSASIRGVWYINQDGLRALPPEYWTQPTGNSVIVFPGAPEHVVFQLAGTGSYDIASRTAVGDTAESVAPPQGVQLSNDVLVIRAPTAEGWTDVPPSVPSANVHAKAGDTVNMLFQILNKGLGSGTITARIHVGRTGTAADPVQKQFTGTIGAFGNQALSANVQLLQDGDIVTLETIGPDGSTTASRKVQTPITRELTPQERLLRQSDHRAAVLSQRIADAIASSPNLAGWRDLYAQAPDQTDTGEIADEIAEIVTPDAPSPEKDERDARKIVDDYLATLSDQEITDLMRDFTTYIDSGNTIMVAPALVAGNASVSYDARTQNVKGFIDVVKRASLKAGVSTLTGPILSNTATNFLYRLNPTVAARLVQQEVQNARMRNWSNIENAVEMRAYHNQIGMRVVRDDLLGKDRPSEVNLSEIKEKLFVNVPSEEESLKGKLIIIILGNDQTLADNQAGLWTEALTDILDRGYETLVFRVGDLKREIQTTFDTKGMFALHPDVVYQHTENIIRDRIMGRGVFTGMPQITEVGSLHYSWGGGTGNRLFGTPEKTAFLLNGAKLKATAYIDAIQLGLNQGLGQAVTKRPSSEHFYNVFQNNRLSSMHIPTAPYILYYPNVFSGEPVHGRAITGAENIIQDLGYDYNHMTIDDKKAGEAKNFVLSHLS